MGKTLERKCKNCRFCIPTKRGPFICGLGANEFVDVYVNEKGEEACFIPCPVSLPKWIYGFLRSCYSGDMPIQYEPDLVAL